MTDGLSLLSKAPLAGYAPNWCSTSNQVRTSWPVDADWSSLTLKSQVYRLAAARILLDRPDHFLRRASARPHGRQQSPHLRWGLPGKTRSTIKSVRMVMGATFASGPLNSTVRPGSESPNGSVVTSRSIPNTFTHPACARLSAIRIKQRGNTRPDQGAAFFDKFHHQIP